MIATLFERAGFLRTKQPARCPGSERGTSASRPRSELIHRHSLGCMGIPRGHMETLGDAWTPWTPSGMHGVLKGGHTVDRAGLSIKMLHPASGTSE